MSDGEWIEVTWGEEVFSPVQYNSFRVGPFSCRVQQRRGETPEQAWDRGYALLRQKAQEERKRKAGEFLAALREVGGLARGA